MAREGVSLGLGANWRQFALLVAVNAFVGAMVGLERSILPLIGEREFGLASSFAIVSFIVAFGLAKAISNLVAGRLSDVTSRRTVLLAGWLIAIPVPFLLIWAPSWGWVNFANVRLGIKQGLTWSMTVNMKLDLAGPKQRGLAMGLNEAAGYMAVSVTALLTGYIAARTGLRPEPFYLGIAYAVLGLGLSTVAVRETRYYATYEAANHQGADDALDEGLSTRDVFIQTSIAEPSLSAASQAGLVNNLNDGMAWGLLPLFFAAAGISVGRIGVLVAIYPAVWGLGQLVTGAWSDRVGRKRLIVAGMWVQAVAIGLIASGEEFAMWAWAMALLGVGTALVYPTLLAAVGDVAHPRWRASAVGVYRMWRDAGFAVGALLAGIIADVIDPPAAIWTVAFLTAASGTLVAVRMRETHPQALARSQ